MNAKFNLYLVHQNGCHLFSMTLLRMNQNIKTKPDMFRSIVKKWECEYLNRNILLNKK